LVLETHLVLETYLVLETNFLHFETIKQESHKRETARGRVGNGMHMSWEGSNSLLQSATSQ